jgi:hypothetical protein
METGTVMPFLCGNNNGSKHLKRRKQAFRGK